MKIVGEHVTRHRFFFGDIDTFTDIMMLSVKLRLELKQ